MKNLSDISTASAKQISPAPKRRDIVPNNLRSALVAALTRELFQFSVPTPRSLLAPSKLREGRLRVSVSLSSLNLSWSPN